MLNDGSEQVYKIVRPYVFDAMHLSKFWLRCKKKVFAEDKVWSNKSSFITKIFGGKADRGHPVLRRMIYRQFDYQQHGLLDSHTV